MEAHLNSYVVTYTAYDEHDQKNEQMSDRFQALHPKFDDPLPAKSNIEL